MKLTYWYARCLYDSEAYSIRAKTRKEALALKHERGFDGYGPVVQATVEADDTFDLLTQCMGEGSGWWEDDSDAGFQGEATPWARSEAKRIAAAYGVDEVAILEDCWQSNGQRMVTVLNVNEWAGSNADLL